LRGASIPGQGAAAFFTGQLECLDCPCRVPVVEQAQRAVPAAAESISARLNAPMHGPTLLQNNTLLRIVAAHLTASSCGAALDSCPELIVRNPSVDRPALPGFGIVGSILITMYE